MPEKLIHLEYLQIENKKKKKQRIARICNLKKKYSACMYI